MIRLARSIFAGVLAAACTAATVSAAGDSGRVSVQVSGRVPTVCRVELTYADPKLFAKYEEAGTIERFCNSSAGYQLVAYHPKTFKGSFEFGGRYIPAANSPYTVLEEIRGPTFGPVDFHIRDTNYGQGKKIFVGVIAKN